MEIPTFFTLFTLLMITFPSIFLESSVNAVDFLVPGQSLTHPETLTSPSGTFELGFFSPENSSNYYLAIRYCKIPLDSLVWIANRDWPIQSPSASLSIYPDGNMVIEDGRKLYQVTNTSATNNSLVKLLDSGNLLLTRRGIDEVFWQSFDYPTATLLPGMKLGYSYPLVSWTSSEDPAPGAFSLTIESSSLIIEQGDTIRWKGSPGEWNFTWPAHGFFTYHDFNDSTACKIVLEVYGQLKQQCWSEEELSWYSVQKRCEFRSCGSFSLCDESPTTPSPCSCLDGFQPRFPDKWKKGETSEGCVRKTSLHCNNGTDQLVRDGLYGKPNVGFPSNPKNLNVSAEECRSTALRNCSLIAYGFHDKCLVWDQDLFDVQPLPYGNHSQVLYYKIAASENITRGTSPRTTESGMKRQGLGGWQKQVLIVAVILLGLLAMLALGLYIYCRSKRNRFTKGAGEDLLLFDMGMSLEPASMESNEKDEVGGDRKREIKLPLFSFSSVSAATDNFSAANKLGEGGFGPVYKGKLLGGGEVAAKRLSRRSGQGWEELENEALLIAKLQHKNLVRLLGCCTERDEKILIYEYMPNKSLDFFLFDPSKRRILDWERRIRIVEGVAQGLLYLHQYSRLRIIHRDLKASNILLDRDMNPKISDFGLARIFGGNESEANTKRIVGTYGYMSPEYALEGLFSIKSDVFSFGVLLLEIMSGKKNTGLYQTASLNLLGYVWDMWTSERVLDLMDPVLELGPSSTHLPLRFVHIGLLCVQESAADRPTMSDIVSMLSNESFVLPSPKEPAFSNVRGTIAQKLPVNSPKSLSVNDVTVSTVQAR